MNDGNAPKSARATLSFERQLDVAWLAGILDGEGCITMPKNGRGIGYAVRVEFFNTCRPMLDKVSRTLRAIGVEHSVYSALKAKTNQLAKKPVYRVVMTRREEIVRCLEHLIPHLTEKRAFAELVVRVFSGRARGSGWSAEDAKEVQQARRKFMLKAV